MDRLDSMRLLVRVIERRSFTAAAADLDIPRSTATEAIKQLERRLGVRLLERTTRVVTPTLDGETYYRRCLSILVEIEEAESAFQDAMPRGLLRIDVHPMIARTFLIPHLPAFLDRYPQIDLHLGEGDRLVDLVREGVDCVIRAGEPTESGMIMRKLATLREMTCASPAYLLRHGTPASPDDLHEHRMIGYLSSRTNEIIPLEFTEGTKLRYVTLASRVTVSGADAMAELARYGLGLIQAPRYRFTEDFAAGTLVEILTDFPPKPTPLFALYPQSRQLSPRVRAFVDWAVDIFAAASV
jgi:DNA-binding transcriptional LysR family regulator